MNAAFLDSDYTIEDSFTKPRVTEPDTPRSLGDDDQNTFIDT